MSNAQTSSPQPARHRHRSRLALGKSWLLALAAASGLLSVPARARADVGLFLNEPTGLGASRYTSAGHSAVYLSDICPASPVKLRMCAPGEQGSVLSTYIDLKEDSPYEWNIIPLSVYLYGQKDPAAQPLYASEPMKKALEARFAMGYLGSVCSTAACQNDPHARWRDLVASTFVRDSYLFAVSTTREQDGKLVDDYNAMPNVNHFNGFTNNCADFAKRVINTYFPGAARPDYLNDFGMTSPKAIARSFTHYAERHPELGLYVVRYTQQPGTLRRSGTCRNGLEVGFHMKKWLIPITYISYHVTGALMLEYVLTARFNPKTELAQHPSAEVTELSYALRAARREGFPDQAALLQAQIQTDRAALLGSEKSWAAYRERFAAIVQDAAASGVIRTPQELPQLLSELNRDTTPRIDPDGSAWLEVSHGPDSRIERRSVGITRATVLQPGSDPQLAYRLMLGRVNFVLHASSGHRESMSDFAEDWSILEKLHDAQLHDAGRLGKNSVATSRPAANPVGN